MSRVAVGSKRALEMEAQMQVADVTSDITTLQNKIKGISYDNNLAGITGQNGGFLSGSGKQALTWDAQGNLNIKGNANFSGTNTFNGDTTFNNNIVMAGNNAWVLHHPDDARNSLFIAPRSGNVWNWGRQTRLTQDGNIINSGIVIPRYSFDSFTNYPGDIRNIPNATLAECMNACRDTPACGGFAYGSNANLSEPNSRSACVLKNNNRTKRSPDNNWHLFSKNW